MIERVLEIISYLAIASALIDSYDFISKLAIGQEESWGWMFAKHPGVFLLELVVVLGIAAIAIRGLIMIRKSKKKEKKS